MCCTWGHWRTRGRDEREGTVAHGCAVLDRAGTREGWGGGGGGGGGTEREPPASVVDGRRVAMVVFL